MENLKELLGKGEKLMAQEKLDKETFHSLENFLLKNGSRLGKDSDFLKLKHLINEIAVKNNLPTIERLQEGFGLNSCAQ